MLLISLLLHMLKSDGISPEIVNPVIKVVNEAIIL